MKLKYLRIPFIAALVLTMTMVSCKDEWDNHYYEDIEGKSDLSLSQYISSREDLSTFASMLKSTGYDTVLNKSQAYTVWVPTNDALSGINFQDTNAVRKIVTNHITQFSLPTSGIESKVLTMLNNKLLKYEKTEAGYTFEGNSIVEPNHAFANGIVHVLNSYAPYKENGWEFLNNTPGIDSVRNYVNSLTQQLLDVEKSYVDGVFVDSVFFQYNKAISLLAKWNIEDSTYTTIYPTNQAWSEAYGRLFPFFKTLPTYGGTTTQHANTKWALIRDMVFRGKVSFPLVKDTLQSTFGNKISNMNEVLKDLNASVLSNGLAYTTDRLKYKATDSWHKEIRVEAETPSSQRILSNYGMSVNSSLGTSMSVSRRYYVTLTPTTSSSISKLFIQFPIPNTLSAKYNVYCQFVPTAIVDTTDKRPYKVKFYMSYVDSTGIQVPFTKAGIDVNNQITATASKIATFTTDPTKPTKMLVAKNFSFSFCNLEDDSDANNLFSPNVFLKVENATGTTAAEIANFNRAIRIDCIILEPVE